MSDTSLWPPPSRVTWCQLTSPLCHVSCVTHQGGILWQMSRWAWCQDGWCWCQLSPLSSLRSKCDTEHWAPCDAEAELEPGSGAETPEFGLVEARVCDGGWCDQASPGLWRLSVAPGCSQTLQSPHRQETSLEDRGWYSHVDSSNHPNLNIAYGCKHTNATQTNNARITIVMLSMS